MTKTKKLGIFMDHSFANIMEFRTDAITTKTITSEFNYDEKERCLKKSESMMHNREQHQTAEYYKKLIAIIKEYKEVLLFGLTDAKVELFNVLREDPRLSKIVIEIQRTDKMTENQQHAFVKSYFEKKLNVNV